MSSLSPAGGVEGLYRQLACQRAGHSRALLVREASLERLLDVSAGRLEDAAGVLLHAASALDAVPGGASELLAEQAGLLLAVAARFEEAADLTRSTGRLDGETPR